ncbi:MAG: hypothetical protein ACREOO_23980 [bacterium]
MITLNEHDLKEIFALFSSVSTYELGQIYDRLHDNFYKNEILAEEYELTQPKREFARDSWRAVIYFLYKQGYQLKKGDQIVDLEFIMSEFVKSKKTQ